MKYKIVPFEPEHWDMIDFREFERETMGNLLEQIRPGVGEAWLVASGLSTKNKLWFVRGVKNWMEKLMNTHQLHRVQTTVMHGHTELIRFVEFLGMEFEGRIKHYGPNKEDYLMYGRTSWPH